MRPGRAVSEAHARASAELLRRATSETPAWSCGACPLHLPGARQTWLPYGRLLLHKMLTVEVLPSAGHYRHSPGLAGLSASPFTEGRPGRRPSMAARVSNAAALWGSFLCAVGHCGAEETPVTVATSSLICRRPVSPWPCLCRDGACSLYKSVRRDTPTHALQQCILNSA